MEQKLIPISSPWILEEFETDASTEIKQRSWASRTFGQMSPGSVRGGLFTLASSALGASALFLPYKMSQWGLIVMLFLLVIWAFINLWSLNALVAAVQREEIYNYAELLNRVIGRWARIVCEAMVVTYSVGILIGFQIIVGSLSLSIWASLGIPVPGFAERIFVMVVMNWAVMIPISSFRDLSKLRFTATWGVISLTYVVLVTLTEFPFYVNQHGFEKVELADVDENIFSSISISLLAYFCHTNVWTVHGQIDQPSVKRMQKITGRCVFIQFLIYASLAVFGYLSTESKTPRVFILRDGPDDLDADWPMVIGRILILIMFVMGIPLHILPCRTSILNVMGKPHPPLWLYLLITYGLLEITLVIAILTPSVLFVFNLIGGICSTTLLAVFPGLIYIKSENVDRWKKVLAWVLVFLLCLTGLITVSVTLMQIASEA